MASQPEQVVEENLSEEEVVSNDTTSESEASDSGDETIQKSRDGDDRNDKKDPNDKSDATGGMELPSSSTSAPTYKVDEDKVFQALLKEHLADEKTLSKWKSDFFNEAYKASEQWRAIKKAIKDKKNEALKASRKAERDAIKKVEKKEADALRSSPITLNVMFNGMSYALTLKRTCTLKDLRDHLIEKTSITKKFAKSLCFMTEGDVVMNDHARRTMNGWKFEDGATINAKVSGQGGGKFGVRKTIGKPSKSEEYKACALEVCSQVKEKVKDNNIYNIHAVKETEDILNKFMSMVLTDPMEAIKHLANLMDEDSLDEMFEKMASLGGTTEFKVRTIARLVFGKPLKSLLVIDEAIGDIVECAEMSLCHAFFKSCETSDAKVSMATIKAIVKTCLDRKIGARTPSQMEA